MKRRIHDKTLEKKVRKWVNVLGLNDWEINAKFIPRHKGKFKKDEQAEVTYYWNEKVANINFNSTYYKDKDCGKVWNIDTLIIHELIHVVLSERMDGLPENVVEKISDLEEFIADYFATIIFRTSEGKRKKV
jgi:hypothetical protein